MVALLMSTRLVLLVQTPGKGEGAGGRASVLVVKSILDLYLPVLKCPPSLLASSHSDLLVYR